MTDHILTDPIINQNDPIVMYIIVRESLGMGMGKTAAQCAHASQMLMIKFNALSEVLDSLVELEDTFGSLNADEAKEWDLEQPKYYIFYEWLNSFYRKVILKADDKEWAKIKAEFPEHVLVVDAGLTEIAPNSETVIGLWPMRKSEVPKSIKRLQVLK